MSNRHKPVLMQRIHEIRYEQGYRYLDRCGDAMLILEDLLSQQTGHVWMPEEAAPSGARMLCPDLDVTLLFDSQHMVIDQNPVGKVSFDFEGVAESAFATISGRFGLDKIARLGYRIVKLIPADTIEDSDKLSLKYIHLDPTYDGQSGYTATSHQATSLFEQPDRSKGISITMNAYAKVGSTLRIDDRLRLRAHQLHEQQREALVDQLKRKKQRELDPEAGLRLDLDFFWLRPHKWAIKAFIAEAANQMDLLEQRILKGRSKS